MAGAAGRIVRMSDMRIATFLPSAMLVSQRRKAAAILPLSSRVAGGGRGRRTRTRRGEEDATVHSLDELVARTDIVPLLLAGCREEKEVEEERRALVCSNVAVAGFLNASDDIVGYARASGDGALVCSVDRCVLSPSHAFADDVLPEMLRRLGEEISARYGIVDIAYGLMLSAPSDAGFEPDKLGSTRLRWPIEDKD